MASEDRSTAVERPGIGANAPAFPLRRIRLSLGQAHRRLSFERRLWVAVAAASLPTIVLAGYLLRMLGASVLLVAVIDLVVFMAWMAAGSYFVEGVVRPMQTLSNIVAALREDDYSFRARGARRGDALGDLALEINALASTLQQQRSSAQDALLLADRVMSSMQSPVLAFDSGGRLRLLNAAAERCFSLRRERSLNRTAASLDLHGLTELRDESLFTGPTRDGDRPGEAQPLRWSVRRASFRLFGVPHSLFVLSDVAAALEEEERLAWQRLIRVMSHEINNSLTPIKSIAGSLRSRSLSLPEDRTSNDIADLRRGLAVIEDRADSLNRFLQAYQQLSRLPEPSFQTVLLRELLARTLPMEPRLRIELASAPEIELRADPDQIQQLLINLLKNATDAALDHHCEMPPAVRVDYARRARSLHLRVIDNGPGLMNPQNLFVPFYTTKPGGAGIGLTLSRQIAAAHRGSVQLSNRTDGQGCIAELILPLPAGSA